MVSVKGMANLGHQENVGGDLPLNSGSAAFVFPAFAGI